MSCTRSFHGSSLVLPREYNQLALKFTTVIGYGYMAFVYVKRQNVYFDIAKRIRKLKGYNSSFLCYPSQQLFFDQIPYAIG